MLFTAPFLLPILCILHRTTVAQPIPPPSCGSASASLPLADLQAAAAQIPNNSSAVHLPEKSLGWGSGEREPRPLPTLIYTFPNTKTQEVSASHETPTVIVDTDKIFHLGQLWLSLIQNSTAPIPPPAEPNTLGTHNNTTEPITTTTEPITTTTWEEVYNATRDMVELCGTRAVDFAIN
ncbi:MAG: hypothetical protein Q9207_008131, partial [Kuettlingeria erythrocarpa]